MWCVVLVKLVESLDVERPIKRIIESENNFTDKFQAKNPANVTVLTMLFDLDVLIVPITK